MENEFDREIDVLLRGLNGATKISVSENEHLDADEIAAFAENAVPQNARLRYITHFADCDSCREILKNFIALENEFQPQTVQNESVVTNIIGAKTVAKTSFFDWFKLPVLTYAMATFTILIIGTIAFLAIRQTSENSETSVARVEKVNQVATSSAPTTIYTEPRNEENKEVESNETAKTTTNSSAMMSNSSTSSMSNTSAKDSNVATNANQKLSRIDNVDKDKTAEKSSSSSSERVDLPPPPKPSKTIENERKNKPGNADAEVLPQSDNGFNQSQNNESNDDILSQNQQAQQNRQSSPTQNSPASIASARKPQPNQTDAKKREAQDSMTIDGSASGLSSRRVENLPLNGRAASDKAIAAKRAKVVVTKQVSGKTFRRENNVWIDSNYNGNGTTNIIRGSDEYKKLDANVRSIAESLGGEVVVISNGKAFRIR